MPLERRNFVFLRLEKFANSGLFAYFLKEVKGQNNKLKWYRLF
jgi:hypothetical protein